MNLLWGGLIVLAGIFFIVCASTKSDFVVYRLFVAKSKILWGEKVYAFHKIIGGMLVVFGILVAIKII